MPYNQGGVIGVNNPTAAGPGSTTEKITSFPASGTFTSQAGQTVADIFLLAGGGSGISGGGGTGGGGAGGAVKVAAQNPPNDGVQGLGAGGGSAYAGQGIGDGGDGFAVVRETAVSFQGSGTGMFRLRTQYDRIVAGTWPSA